MVEFVRWKLSWCCMFVQVLRVLVKLYFNLQTPDYISVSQVLHFSDFGFLIFNYVIFQMTNSVSIYRFQICSKSTLKLIVFGVFITNFELIPEEIFTSSKSTTETLVKGVKHVNNKDTRMTTMRFCWLYFRHWTYFLPFSSVSMIDFEAVNVCWVSTLFSPVIYFLTFIDNFEQIIMC